MSGRISRRVNKLPRRLKTFPSGNRAYGLAIPRSKRFLNIGD